MTNFGQTSSIFATDCTAVLFNRLYAIWPKGYQRGSLPKNYKNGNYLKQAIDISNAKKRSFHRIRTCCLQINYRSSAL